MSRFAVLSLVLVLAGCAPGPRPAADAEGPYAVAPWPGFRAAAVSHTFDDNDANQLPVAVPLFDAHGFGVTLFAVTDADWRPIDWPALADAAARGHEVASHTVSHPRLDTLSADAQTRELARSREAIEAHVPARRGLTIAYPYCRPGDPGVTRAHYFAARGCGGGVQPATPDNLFNVGAVIVGAEGDVQTAADLDRFADEAARAGGWIVFLTHGVDDDGGWSPVASEELAAHVDHLAAHPDRFWVAPFGEVARYVRARDAAVVEEISAGADSLVVHVSDELDDAVYDLPLTIRRALPDGWTAASAAQSGTPVPARVDTVDGVPSVVFEAVPDAGDVVLRRAG